MTNLIVRCINSANNAHITVGKEYAVIQETLLSYNITSDSGVHYPYSKGLFEVVPPINLRPHTAEIIAWANGATIQYRYTACTSLGQWHDCIDNLPKWLAAAYEYRVKPDKPINPNADKIVALEKSIADATRALAAAKENLNKLK